MTFVGTLTRPSAEERVVSIELVRASTPDNGDLLFRIEAFALGTWRSPTFTPAPLKLVEPQGLSSGMTFPDGDGYVFEAIEHRPGESVVIGVPAIDPSDPATVRMPIRRLGIDDAIRITLQEEDAVAIRLESGRLLPLRPSPSPTVQPADRSPR